MVNELQSRHDNQESTIQKVQREVIQKYKYKLSSLHSAHCLINAIISMKFYVDTLKVLSSDCSSSWSLHTCYFLQVTE